MGPSEAVARRRVTGAEEEELVAARDAVDQAKEALNRAWRERDRIVARLIDDNARTGDVREILGFQSTKAVQDAASRGRLAEQERKRGRGRGRRGG